MLDVLTPSGTARPLDGGQTMPQAARGAHSALHSAIQALPLQLDGYSGRTPCAGRGWMFEDFIQGENQARRLQRWEAAASDCYDCPVFELCNNVAEADPMMHGVLAGRVYSFNSSRGTRNEYDPSTGEILEPQDANQAEETA